jgi:hypothetical protein
VAPAPQRHLRLAPEPKGEPRARVPLLLTIGLVLLALVLGLIAVGWQHGLVTDRDLTISAMQGEVAGLSAQVSTLEGELAAAQATIDQQVRQIAGLEARNAELVQRYQMALGNQQSAQAELAQMQAELITANSELATANAELATTSGQLAAANETIRTMLGNPLPEGKHDGLLMAVGAAQSPPRLVIDRIKQVDGVFVNENPGWRTMEIAPDATVVVYGLNPYHAQTIPLERLAHLFVNPAPWAVRVANAPFRITVSDGVVTAIREIPPTG